MKSVNKVLVYVLLVVICLVTVYPIVQIFGISLRPANQLYSTSQKIIPDNASFNAYYEVLFEKDFFTWLRNSIFSMRGQQRTEDCMLVMRLESTTRKII